MKNKTDHELIARFNELLTQKGFSFADAVELQKINNELSIRKSVKVIQSHARIQTPLTHVTKTEGEGATVNLIVMDKESVPEISGLKKYSFGYALDSTKKFEDENIVKAFDYFLPAEFRADSIVAVKVKGVRPVKDGKFYRAELSTPLAFEAKKDKLHSAKEIIRKAFASNVLEITRESAVDLCKSGILTFDIDKHFGLQIDKVRFVKAGQKFGEHGVVYGVVYPVDEVDTDGDSATADEVMKACWRFMEDYQNLNFMHKNGLTQREVSIVECAIAPADIPDMGFKKGDWYMAVRVRDQELKKMIESGEITGFSMEGTALPGGE
jgi:hypothetical protein